MTLDSVNAWITIKDPSVTNVPMDTMIQIKIVLVCNKLLKLPICTFVTMQHVTVTNMVQMEELVEMTDNVFVRRNSLA